MQPLHALGPVCVVLGLWASAGQPQAARPGNEPGVQATTAASGNAPIEGVTRPRYDAQLGFPLTGKVEQVMVKPGDRVVKDQELIRLDDAVPRAQIEQLELRAQSELEIKAAQADWDLAKLQRQLMTESFQRNAATALELERATLEAEKSRLALELFRQRRDEAKGQLVEARERLRQMTLRAPRDGVVDRLVAEPGEVVQEQRPVLRLVDTSVLRIEAAIPTDRTLTLQPGQDVWIRYPNEFDRPAIRAKLLALAAVADAASNTRIARIEFDNSDQSPAGRMVLVYLRPQ